MTITGIGFTGAPSTSKCRGAEHLEHQSCEQRRDNWAFDNEFRSTRGCPVLAIEDGLSNTFMLVEDTGRRARFILEGASLPQVEMWDADRKAGLFLKAFDTELELVWRDPAGRTTR